MGNQTPNVEWQIVENEADWERLQTPPTPAIHAEVSRRLRLRRYLWGGAVLLLLVLGVGGEWWRSTQAASHQHAVGVQPTTQNEPESAGQRADSMAASLKGHPATMDGEHPVAREDKGLIAVVKADKSGAQFDLNVHILALQDDQAVVNVDAPALASAPARQEIRFYRRTDAGWLRTEPDAALWGAERSLETPYFIYYFRQNDAQAIVAVAPQIDALYTTLRRNFGLPVSPAGLPGSFADDKLVIEVSVSQSPGTIRFQPHHYAERFVWPDRWVVASPAVYLAPVELTDADLLMQSLALPLLTDGLRQASQRYAIGAAWQPLLEGLSLWQEWELNLPLSAWHDEVVRWQYTEWPPTRPGQRVVLPEHYSDLCARTKLWLSSPLEMNLPLVCAAQRWEYQYLAPWSVTDPLTRLDQLAASDSFVRPSPRQPGETVALATLIEYAVATYGRERLPALVVSLGQYDRWETLIPAVYGVSASDFESGWQAYLAAHYGVAPLLSQQATQAQ